MKKVRMAMLYICALALLVSSLASPSPAQAHAPGVVLSAYGTATIDGVAASSEWASAGCVSIPINVPDGTTPGKVCAMNDDTNLYLMVVFQRAVEDEGNSAAFAFDNTNNGDGQLLGNDGLIINPTIGFRDEVRSPCPSEGICGVYDTSLGGTNDGLGMFVNDGSFTVYEYSHPLRSGDVNDFSLKIGDTVGFMLAVRIISNGAIFDTDYPACTSCENLYGDILIASPAIAIDIKPGGSRNTINPKSHGKIPVALLSTSTFNIPAAIDPASLTFGRTGNEQSLAFCERTSRDVNGDKLPDLICHFDTQDAGFLPSDVVGTLKGKTLNGQLVIGTDSVRILP